MSGRSSTRLGFRIWPGQVGGGVWSQRSPPTATAIQRIRMGAVKGESFFHARKKQRNTRHPTHALRITSCPSKNHRKLRPLVHVCMSLCPCVRVCAYMQMLKGGGVYVDGIGLRGVRRGWAEFPANFSAHTFQGLLALTIQPVPRQLFRP